MEHIFDLLYARRRQSQRFVLAMVSCPPAFVDMIIRIIITLTTIRIIITLADSVAIREGERGREAGKEGGREGERRRERDQKKKREREREQMAQSWRRQWGQSSSDNEEPLTEPPPAKAKRWTADSSDEEFKGASSSFRCSEDAQQPKKSRHWLAPESESSSDDIWRRRHNVGSARKHVGEKTTAKSRPWTQDSSSTSRPWIAKSSSSDGECPGSSAQGRSGVPVQAKRLGKPVVDVTLGAMQLTSTSFTVREKLNSFEEWGFDAKRLKLVTRNVVCKCKRQCHEQLTSEELAALCTWYHGHLTFTERQYVIHTLYHQATNDDNAGVLELNQQKDHDRVLSRAQWRLQGNQ